MYTRCPHCDTVYRVTPQQLQASSGQVRCGRCRTQFDAFSTLTSSLPAATDAPATTSAQETPSAPDASAAVPAAEAVQARSDDDTALAVSSQPASPAPAAVDAEAGEVFEEAGHDPVAHYVQKYRVGWASDEDDAETSAPEDDAPAPEVDIEEIEALPARSSFAGTFDEAVVEEAPDRSDSAAAQAMLHGDDVAAPPLPAAGVAYDQAPSSRQTSNEDDEDVQAVDSRPALEASQPELTLPDQLLEAGPVPLAQPGRWVAANAALAVLLLIQMLWWLASPIALGLPAVRPVLEGACGWLGCEVALPRVPEQLYIEGSDLQLLDVARPNEVLLTAQVRNRAAVAQQLPLIELTLTGTANQVVARRVLHPREYLEGAARSRGSIAANEEVALRLYLNTGDVRAAGYRLYLFFG